MNRSLRVACTLALALFAAAAHGQGATVLAVRKEGGDGAFRSLGEALDEIPQTMAGPYVIEIRDSETYEEAVVVSVRSSATATLTIRAEAGRAPRIVSDRNRKAALTIESPFTAVEGLTLQGGDQSEGVHISWADDNTVRGCTIQGAHDQDTPGVYIQGGQGNLVVGNEIRDNDVGVLVFDAAGDGNAIRNNRIHGNEAKGIWIYRESANTQVVNNTLYDNRSEIYLGHDGDRRDDPGTGNTFRNNVVVARQDDGACLRAVLDEGDGHLPAGTVSDYNVLRAEGATPVGRLGDTVLRDLAAWQSATGADAHSLGDDPRLVHAPDDLHLQSTTGSFHGGSWTADANQSAAIDAGDPADAFDQESAPNGGRVNMGAYGNTAEASRSAAAWPLAEFSAAAQGTDGTGRVQVAIAASPGGGLPLRARVEWGPSRDGEFHAATLAEPVAATVSDAGGVPSLDNGARYQVGAADGRRIVTAGGRNTVTFGWDSAADLPGADGQYWLRLTASDGSVDQDAPALLAVTVDNAAPAGLADLQGGDLSSTAITWIWTPATAESHFAGYSVWYGTDRADVEGRRGSAAEWDAGDDGALAQMATARATITGLSRATAYYAQVQARDAAGNAASAPTASFATAGRDTVYHYVATGGGHEGTPDDPSHPWASIQRAHNAIPKNVARQRSWYVVQIQDSGRYAEDVVINRTADATYSVTLRAAAGQRPTIAPPASQEGVTVRSAWARVEGLDVEVARKSGILVNAADGVCIRACQVRGGDHEAGIQVLRSSGVRVEGNRIHDGQIGIWLAREASRSSVRHNLILGDGSRAQGLYLDRDAAGDTVVNNAIVGYRQGLAVRGDNQAAGRGHVVRNNILHRVGTCLYLEGALGSTFAQSDYNYLHPSDGGAVGHIDGRDYATLSDWRAASGLDGASQSLDPLFAAADGSPSTMDLHLRSQSGRWDGVGFALDEVTSPAIDAGDPGDDYHLETAPNGNRINLGAYGGTAQASRSGPITVALGGIPYGQFVMLGVPVVPVDGNPDAVLGDDFPGEGEGDPWGFWWRLVRWDVTGDDYQYYNERDELDGNPPDLGPGRGYWLIQWWSLEGDDDGAVGDTVTVTGVPVAGSEDYAIPLEVAAAGGINQLANPFLFDLDWADARVRDNGSGRVASVAQAARDGWIDGHAYLWNWEREAYVPLPADEGGRITAWRGFWVEQLDASRRLDLLLPAVPAGAAARKPLAARPAADDWHVEFAVAAAPATGTKLQDIANRAGVRPDASRRHDPHDALDLPALAEPHLYVYFPHDDPADPLSYWPDRPGRYTYDLRDPAWDEQAWTFVVDTDLTDADLVWTWTNPGQIPRGYRVWLEDADAGQVVLPDLAAAGTWAFGSGPTGLRTFRLRAEYRDVPGDVTGDRSVDAADADRILRHAVGGEPLAAAEVALAEVTGNGAASAAVTAYDAAWVLRYGAGLTETFPVEGAAAEAPPALERALYLGEASPVAGGAVSIPVVVDRADGVLSGTVRLAFDAAHLAVADVAAAMGSRAAFAAADGRLVLAFAAAAPAAGRQVVARILVRPAAAGTDLLDHLRVESVELDEGRMAARVLSPRPETHALYSPAPNPFNGSVTVRYGLPEAGPVTLTVYNAIGQPVRTLVGGSRDAGLYAVIWDGRDDGGRPVASGVYLVRMVAGTAKMTAKVSLVR